jgi:hypothetical protein
MHISALKNIGPGKLPVIRRTLLSELSLNDIIKTSDGIYMLEEIVRHSACNKKRVMILRPIKFNKATRDSNGMCIVKEVNI